MYFTGDVREPEHLEKVYASMAACGFPVRGQLGVAVVEMLLVFGPPWRGHMRLSIIKLQKML